MNGLVGAGTSLTSANKELSKGSGGSKTDIKDTNGEINDGLKTNVDTSNSSENLSKKTSPPKPVPRKVSRRKPVDRNPFDPSNVTEGTVVSIYEKRDVTRRSRKDSSSTSGSKPDLKTDSDTSQKSNSKRDHFPHGEGSELKPRFGNSSLLGPSKTRGGLSLLGDLPALDGGSSQKLRGDDRLNPVPMDIDVDSDQENNGDKDSDLIGKNAPSDATVHRFRALRMTPDRSRSEESLKNAQFAPKPPSTPRSARRNSSKGEKRNREANSSDEGQDIDSKKQNSEGNKISENIVNSSLSNLQMAEVGMDVDIDNKVEKKPAKGIVLHPDVKEVKDISELNVNQNMHDPDRSLSHENLVKPSVSSESQAQRTGVEISPDMSFNVSPDKYAFDMSPVEKKGAMKNLAKTSVRKLLPLDESDLNASEKPSLDTLGSASDLQAINANYKKVLQEKTPSKELPTLGQNTPKPSGSGSMFDIVMPEPKPNAGKLAPIQPKNPPPPLTEDMKSQSMRVSYKTDPSYPLPKYFARSVSGGSTSERSKFETMSVRSNFALSAIPSVATKDARDR